MNKIAKYVSSTLFVVAVSYVAWIMIRTTFPVDEWFDQNPIWRTFFILLVIIGIIGIISAIIRPKGNWN